MPIALKFHFLKESYSIRYTIWAEAFLEELREDMMLALSSLSVG